MLKLKGRMSNYYLQKTHFRFKDINRLLKGKELKELYYANNKQKKGESWRGYTKNR